MFSYICLRSDRSYLTKGDNYMHHDVSLTNYSRRLNALLESNYQIHYETSEEG